MIKSFGKSQTYYQKWGEKRRYITFLNLFKKSCIWLQKRGKNWGIKNNESCVNETSYTISKLGLSFSVPHFWILSLQKKTFKRFHKSIKYCLLIWWRLNFVFFPCPFTCEFHANIMLTICDRALFQFLPFDFFWNWIVESLLKNTFHVINCIETCQCEQVNIFWLFFLFPLPHIGIKVMV